MNISTPRAPARFRKMMSMMCFLVEANSIAHHSATLSSATWLLLLNQQG